MSDEEWSDDEELEDEELDLGSQIKKLKQSVLETKSMLESINQALISQGNPREVLFPKEMEKFKPQPGIRINGQLSFRGEDMAAEYFDFLDEDGDGRVTFADIRASMSAAARDNYGFEHTDVYRYWDSWRMQLADVSIRTEDDGTIRKEEFVKMRKFVELKQPLVAELKLAGMGFLPKLQAKWRTLQVRVNEAIANRDDDPDNDDDPNYLNLDEMSFVCASAGIVYSKAELMEGMIVRARLEKCLQQLKRRVFKKDYVEDPEKYRGQLLNHGLPPPEDDVSRDDIGKRDMRRCRPHMLLAWLHSDGPKPTRPDLHQFFLRFKYSTFQFIRKAVAFSGWLWDMSLYLKERDLFKDFISIEPVIVERKKKKDDKPRKGGLLGTLKKPDEQKKKESDKPPTEKELKAAAEKRAKEQRKARMDAARLKEKQALNVRASSVSGVEIGNIGEIGEDGTSISIKMSALEKMEHYLGARDLPKDVGCMVIVELLIRDGVSDDDVDRAVSECKLLFTRTFDNELSRNRYYKGTYWVPGLSESDGARVIRVGLAYRRNVSIDSLLKQSKVPYTTPDFIPDLTVDFAFNIHFLDLLNSSMSVKADDLLAFKAVCSVEQRRDIIVKVFQRLAMALSAGVARRTVEETVAAQEEAAKAAAKRVAEGVSVDGSLDMSTLFIDQWAHLRGFFPKCVDYCKSIVAWLNGSSNLICTARFEKLSDVLTYLGNRNQWFRQNIPVTMATTPGAFPKKFMELQKRLKLAIAERFQHVQNKFDAEVVKEEERQYEMQMGSYKKKKKKKKPKQAEGGEGAEGADNGELVYDEDGFDQHGFDRDGYDENGLDKDGFAEQGMGRPMTGEAPKKEVKLTKAEQQKLEEEAAEAARIAKEEAIMGRLKRLGVQVEEEDLFVDVDEGKTPQQVAHEECDVETKAVAASLQTWERFWNVVVGIHLVDVVAGKTKISAKCNGMDLMELFPRPPSVLEAKSRQKAQIEEVKAKYKGTRKRTPQADNVEKLE